MKEKVVLFWFRRDLRLDDNAGLYAALTSGFSVVPFFIFDTDILSELEEEDDKRVSFIHAALLQMQETLMKYESTLDIRHGRPLETIKALVANYDAAAVYTNHDYEPAAIERDATVNTFLAANGIAFHTYKDQVVFERAEVTKDDGNGYTVFTPFAKRWRATLKKHDLQEHASERNLTNFYKQKPKRFPPLEQLGFVPNNAVNAVASVDGSIIQHYHQTRDTQSVHGTTRLGVHLRFGTVSVRKLAAKALELNGTFLNELIWREFFMQLLWRQPRLVAEASKPEYDNIRWRNNEAEFQKWCNGQTGFPIVDAGMRELNETGFMHNRVRMIAGSFLVKDLLVDWRWGEAYFARKLLDFELSSNNGNWQWVAGCGCDAAPYFRVFNPTLQAKRFDPKSAYTRRWIPELEDFSYPEPMVNHEAAKQRCLNAYKTALGRREAV